MTSELPSGFSMATISIFISVVPVLEQVLCSIHFLFPTVQPRSGHMGRLWWDWGREQWLGAVWMPGQPVAPPGLVSGVFTAYHQSLLWPSMSLPFPKLTFAPWNTLSHQTTQDICTLLSGIRPGHFTLTPLYDWWSALKGHQLMYLKVTMPCPPAHSCHREVARCQEGLTV